MLVDIVNVGGVLLSQNYKHVSYVTNMNDFDSCFAQIYLGIRYLLNYMDLGPE